VIPGLEFSRIAVDDLDRTEQCGRLMISSEPWITLQRTLDGALESLRDPGKELHGVLRGDDLVGFVLLDMRGPLAGYIQSICVRPDQRGRGVGAALIAWVEQRVHRESPNLFLFVSSFNDAARRFYERLGFVAVGSVPEFIVRGSDEILMRKTLGPLAEFRNQSQ
jgi:ribosomal protein S18 acetylase RimI-like enzyme